MLSLRKLKPYRDIAYIQRSSPSLPTFRLAYRCIKLWAVRHGLYSSKFGYLGGVHITLLLSHLHKQLSSSLGHVDAADLVCGFFHHYSRFDWKSDMVYDSFFHKTTPKYQRSAREPMVILGFHAPNANVAQTSTVPGLEVIMRELKRADELLPQHRMTWERFFGHGTEGSGAGVLEFLASHNSYAQVNIQYWGRTLSKGKGLVGWLESRCVSLVVGKCFFHHA